MATNNLAEAVLVSVDWVPLLAVLLVLDDVAGTAVCVLLELLLEEPPLELLLELELLELLPPELLPELPEPLSLPPQALRTQAPPTIRMGIRAVFFMSCYLRGKGRLGRPCRRRQNRL